MRARAFVAAHAEKLFNAGNTLASAANVCPLLSLPRVSPQDGGLAEVVTAMVTVALPFVLKRAGLLTLQPPPPPALPEVAVNQTHGSSRGHGGGAGGHPVAASESASAVEAAAAGVGNGGGDGTVGDHGRYVADVQQGREPQGTALWKQPTHREPGESRTERQKDEKTERERHIDDAT